MLQKLYEMKCFYHIFLSPHRSNMPFCLFFEIKDVSNMFPTKYSWPFLFFWPLKYAICFQQNIPGHFFGSSNMLYVFNKIFLAISLPIRYALCLQQNIPSHFIWPLKYAICFQQNIPGHFLAHQICSMFSTKNHWPCSMPIRHALCFQQNIPGNIQRPLNILYTSNRISWAMFFQIY